MPITILKNKIKKAVHHLRKQPEETRTHILHALTIFAAVVMIILWTYSLGQSFGGAENKAKIKYDLQPFAALKDNLVDGYKSISVPSADVVR